MSGKRDSKSSPIREIQGINSDCVLALSKSAKLSRLILDDSKTDRSASSKDSLFKVQGELRCRARRRFHADVRRTESVGSANNKLFRLGTKYQSGFGTINRDAFNVCVGRTKIIDH